MKKLKKLTAVILSVIMVTSMVGCGTKDDAPATEAAEATQATTEEAKEITEEVTEEPLPEGNMIKNGDFSDGTNGFDTYTNGGSVSINVNSDKALSVDITDIGSVAHGVQVYHDGFALKQGVEYRFSFDIYSTIDRDVEWRIQVNGGDYHAYYSQIIAVTSEVQHVSASFRMEEGSDPAPRLCFNMGCMDSMAEAGVDPASVEEHSVVLDNLELVVADASAAVAEEAAVEAPHVKINQLGYQTAAKKIAVFSDLEDGVTTFRVVNADSGETAYEGELTEKAVDKGSGEQIRTGEFTELDKAGSYKVVAGDGQESYTFQIKDGVYDETFNQIVKMLYLQRCGMELGQEAGDFAHPVCHTELATVYGTDKKIDVSGGWHDAGDYGRYVVSGAKAVQDLLLAYELYNTKNTLAGTAKLPDKDSNGLSDLLDEVKYELDWMLKMQDSASGGVYHKVTCKVFPETVMPEEETDELIVSPISKTATADFAAVMARAGRLFEKCGEGAYVAYGVTCLEAAKKAFAYCEEHKGDRNFKNPADIVTGEYPDNESQDEYFWAAAELYRATEDSKYKEAAAEYMQSGRIENYGEFGWQSVAGYGAYALLTTDILLADSSNLYRDVQNAFFTAAKDAVAVCKENGYMASRGTSYEWGSNMGIANTGMLLCMANELDPSGDYATYAEAQMHYLMGVNATGYCFVTGAGTLSPKNPHHRPSEVLGKCMPGMLVGGPNSALEDPYAKAVLSDAPAAKCYADNAQSYSCNEVTIYWNSPLIYLMLVMGE